MPARSAGSAVSCDDPSRPHRRPDPSTGVDALLALFIPRLGCRLDGILEARAAAGLARSFRLDQARRGGAGRRSASVHGASAVFQGSAGAAAASIRGGRIMTGTIEPMVGRYVHVE